MAQTAVTRTATFSHRDLLLGKPIFDSCHGFSRSSPESSATPSPPCILPFEHGSINLSFFSRLEISCYLSNILLLRPSGPRLSEITRNTTWYVERFLPSNGVDEPGVLVIERSGYDRLSRVSCPSIPYDRHSIRFDRHWIIVRPSFFRDMVLRRTERERMTIDTANWSSVD